MSGYWPPDAIGLDPKDYTGALPFPKLNAAGTAFEPDGGPEGSGGAGSGEFTVVLIPDTQYLSNSATWIAHFQALADWIVANRDARNIQLVLHLGDVVEQGTTTQYDRADGPMTTLYDAGIPFVAAIGNHDYDGATDGAVSDHDATTVWNSYFGQGRYTNRPWWDGGFKDTGKSENMYLLTTLGGAPTLVLVLEFFPRAATMAWADSIIETHPDRQVIVLTHAYLFHSGERSVDGDQFSAGTYAITDTTNGAQMWDQHLSKHPNVVQVYNGHFINGPQAAGRADYTDAGTLTYQQFTNWQMQDQGGDGRIVLMQGSAAHRWGKREVFNARNDAFEPAYDLAFPWTSYVDLPQLDARYGAIEPTPDPSEADTHRLVTLHDFGTGLEPVTDDNGLWLYGTYPGVEF